LRAEFSDDGTGIITRLANQPSRVWDAADGHLRKEFPGYAEFVAATTRILSRGRSQDLWDAKTLAPIATFPPGGWLRVNDSKTVGASLDDSGGLQIWDLSSGAPRVRLPLSANSSPIGGRSDFDFWAWANPSGSRVVALTRAGTFDKAGRLSIWDTATQAQLAAVEDLSMKAFFYRPEVSFAAAADRLALWTEDYGVLGWNGERLIHRDGISKVQIGTTPWFGEDAGQPLLFSSDGSGLLAALQCHRGARL
jgi:WD40 repeat protein